MAALTNPTYIQHGTGTAGPFLTELVALKHEAGNYYVLFVSKWRKVHMTQSRTWIAYQGSKIDVLIEGV